MIYKTVRYYSFIVYPEIIYSVTYMHTIQNSKAKLTNVKYEFDYKFGKLFFISSTDRRQ